MNRAQRHTLRRAIRKDPENAVRFQQALASQLVDSSKIRQSITEHFPPQSIHRARWNYRVRQWGEAMNWGCPVRRLTHAV